MNIREMTVELIYHVKDGDLCSYPVIINDSKPKLAIFTYDALETKPETVVCYKRLIMTDGKFIEIDDKFVYTHINLEVPMTKLNELYKIYDEYYDQLQIAYDSLEKGIITNSKALHEAFNKLVPTEEIYRLACPSFFEIMEGAAI